MSTKFSDESDKESKVDSILHGLPMRLNQYKTKVNWLYFRVKVSQNHLLIVPALVQYETQN